MPHTGNAGVFLGGPLSSELFGIGAHGAELVNRKGLSVQANAFLGIKNGAVVVQLNGESRQ